MSSGRAATADDADPVPPHEGSRPQRDKPRWLLVATLFSAVPVVRMLGWIRQGTVVQYADYWRFVEAAFRRDGWLQWGALVELHGQHLVSVPLVLYWANMRLFGGSNITLGYGVAVMVLAQAALLWGWILRAGGLSDLVRTALAVATAALLFAPHGAWNFLLAMSGTAWLLSNLLAVAAITLMVRDRRWAAVAVGAVATVTYGTGLLVWPALGVVALVARRGTRSLVAAVGGGAVCGVTYFALRSSADPNANPRPGPWELTQNTATVVGGLITRDEGLARWIGAIVLVLTVVLAGVAAYARSADTVPWTGLATFAVGNAALIGFTRHFPGPDPRPVLFSSRYSSIAALVWLSMLALAVLVVPLRPRRPASFVAAAAIGVVALVAAFGDTGEVGRLQETERSQQQLADALKVGVAEGGPWLIYEWFPDLTPLLSSVGHHPFDSRYEGGCGLLGSSVSDEDLVPVGEEVATGRTVVRPQEKMTSAVVFTTWVERPRSNVDCVAVVDEDGLVVGVGRGGYPAPQGLAPGAEGLWAIAPRGSESYRLVVRFGGSELLYQLPAATRPPP